VISQLSPKAAVKPTRGERNSNVGNIERMAGTTWKGQSPDQSSDARFVVFTSPVWGIRALARTLLTYSRVYPQDTPRDIDTVAEIIRRWAPSTENDTAAYISAVCKSTGFGPDQPIDVTDKEVMEALVLAICRQENGRVNYPLDVIEDGVQRALA
jgi:hypothetical protein